MPCKLKPRKQIRARQTVGTAEKGKEQNFFWTAKLCEELKVALAGKREEVTETSEQTVVLLLPWKQLGNTEGYKEGIRRSY